MLGPLVKAQLVAFLTKKLLDSPLFVGFVQKTHSTVSQMQERAYDSLLEATEKSEREAGKGAPPRSIKQELDKQHAYDQAHRPKPDQPIAKQNDELLKFIERTKRDLASSSSHKDDRHHGPRTGSSSKDPKTK